VPFLNPAYPEQRQFDPGVRQLWPSAHGAAGYRVASRRSNGTPSVTNHPLATEIHQMHFHFLWQRHKQDIPSIRTQFPDKHPTVLQLSDCVECPVTDKSNACRGHIREIPRLS